MKKWFVCYREDDELYGIEAFGSETEAILYINGRIADRPWASPDSYRVFHGEEVPLRAVSSDPVWIMQPAGPQYTSS
jgi:hypothetical protein